MQHAFAFVGAGARRLSRPRRVSVGSKASLAAAAPTVVRLQCTSARAVAAPSSTVANAASADWHASGITAAILRQPA